MPLETSIAMIGGSFMAKVHSSAYAVLPSSYSDPSYRVKRKVLAEASDALARSAAASLGFEEWSTDWREVLKRDDVDAVDIVAPNWLHYQIALEAAAQHKRVMCEKPLGRNLAEAREMVAAVNARVLLTSFCFNYRLTPAIALAKAVIDEGRLGCLRRFRGFYLQDWARYGDVPFSWRFSREEAGSRASGDIASHLIDYALYLGPPIRRVCALTKRSSIEGRMPQE